MLIMVMIILVLIINRVWKRLLHRLGKSSRQLRLYLHSHKTMLYSMLYKLNETDT